MSEFATIFLALIFSTTPFLLAGVAIAVIAGPWLERSLSSTAMRHPVAGLVAGTSAGMLVPACDCGSRPLAHRMAVAGKREFAMAFMIAAPVVNPIVLITTWLAFRDVELVALRFGITAVMAVTVGLVLARFRGEVALPVADMDHCSTFSWREVPSSVLSEFFLLFKFLVLGSAMAAFIQVFVDQSFVTSASGIYLTVTAMMLLAFLLSICSSVDAFVVAGLGGALGTGPLLAFLTFGPVVNLKSMPMYLRLFSVPAVLAIVVLATQIAFVSSVVVQLRAW